MQLIGLILPVLINVVNKLLRVTDSDIRLLTTLIVCGIFGFGFNYLETLFIFPSLIDGFNSIASTIMLVFGLSQVSYQVVFKDDSVVKKLVE